jgi:hypothetical protein
MSAVLVLPSALPYLLQKQTMPEFERSFAENVRNSADLVDYLRLNPDNVLARFNPPVGNWWDGFFPGLVATGLAAVAMAAARRDHARRPPPGESRGRWGEMGYFPVLGITGLVLSLGPFLHVAGHRLWIPLPYALCYFLVPGFSSMRAPARFAVLVALSVAVLAGSGLDALRRRHPRLGPVLLVVTLLGAGALAWSPTIPFVAYADRASMPPVYGWLAAQPDSLPVLELPCPLGVGGPRDLRRQMYVLYHGKPRLDGESGFISSRYEAFREDMQAFPAREAIRRAYEMGARRLIVHYGDYEPARRADVRHRVEGPSGLREVAVFGPDVVYEIEEPRPE